MAPSHSRHLLVWTTLPIAVLLSYLWFRRKRVEAQSDPGLKTDQPVEKTLEEELREAETAEKSSPRTFSRSLSGVDSAPIDIIFPPELKSVKSSQKIISDEDLDFEIEKIKSMKNSVEFYKKKETTSCTQVKSVKQKTPKQTPETSPVKGVAQKITLKQASPISTSVKKEEKVAKEAKQSPPASCKKTEMAQKDVITLNSVEKKISSMKIETQEPNPPENIKTVTTAPSTVTEHDIQRQSSERDSANHSPADVMLASPSLSSISDSHSEGSSDSGKGCSEVATPPSRTPAGDGSVSGDIALSTIYEFVIPQHLVGKLIGKHGSFVSQIKNKAHAHIIIKKHPENNKLKICIIEGLQSQINHALEMIRDRFPEKRYSDLTLEQVSFSQAVTTVPLLPEHLCIKLVEGINNDTIVSCMVAPNHLFLQQPTHPAFPNLNVLSNYMNICYADANSPMLPNPMPENPVCAAYSLGAWYRALVLSTDSENDLSYVKFLDYGGYANVKNSDLRQIRADFLMLPFQASECFLANIRPAGGEDAEWCEEAYNFVADLTKGAIVYTQIVEYTEDGVPLVLIYVAVGPQRLVFLNAELVNRGFGEWAPFESEEVEGAVGGVNA